jgi:hypothetical protein
MIGTIIQNSPHNEKKLNPKCQKECVYKEREKNASVEYHKYLEKNIGEIIVNLESS